MEAGRLRHLVEIQSTTEEQEPNFGEAVTTWTTKAVRHANIQPLVGRELVQALQVHTECTHKVTMRWMDSITTQDRLNFNGRILHILSVVNEGERNRTLTLVCVERS